jgi:hypothetical protein
LVEKKKSKYAVLNYLDPGDDDTLGLPTDDGHEVPLIDALHRHPLANGASAASDRKISDRGWS